MKEKSPEKAKQDEDGKYAGIAQLIIAVKSSEGQHNEVVHALQGLEEGLPTIRYVKNEEGTIVYSRQCDVNEPYIGNEFNILSLALEHWSVNSHGLISSIIGKGISSASVEGLPSNIFLLSKISVKREKLANLMEKSFELFREIVNKCRAETEAVPGGDLLGKLEEAIKKNADHKDLNVKAFHNLVIERVVAVSPGDVGVEIREVFNLVTELIVQLKSSELASDSSQNSQQLFGWGKIVNEIDEERGLYKRLRGIFNAVVNENVDLSQEIQQKKALKFVIEKGDSESLDLLLSKHGLIKVMGGLDCIKDQALKDMIAQILTQQVGGMDLDTLVDTVWAVGMLNIRNEDLKVRIAGVLTKVILERMSTEDLGKTVWGVGSLRIEDPSLKQRIAGVLTKVRLEGMSTEDLGKTVSGVGSLHIEDASLKQRIAVVLTLDKLKGMSPNTLAGAVCGVAGLKKIRNRDLEIMIITALTADKLGGMHPNFLADTIDAIFNLGLKNRGLKSKVATALTEGKLREMDLNTFIATVDAIHNLNIENRGLKTRIAGALTLERLAAMNPNSLANTVFVVHQLNIHNEALKAIIAQALTADKLRGMHPNTLADTVENVVRLIPNPDLIARIAQALTPEKLREMHSSYLASTVYGVGKLNIQDDALKASIAAALTPEKLREMHSSALEKIAYGVGKLNIQDDALKVSIDEVLTEVKPREMLPDNLTPDDLAYAVMYVVRLNIQNAALNARVAVVLTQFKLEEMSPGSLAHAVCSVGSLGIEDPSLKQRIAGVLTADKLGGMHPNNLAEIVYGVGKLKIQNDGLKAMIDGLLTVDKLRGMNPDYLAYAVWGVAQFNIENQALNSRIAEALTLEKLAAMNPDSLACAVRDVVRLNIQNEALNARIAEALTLEKLAAMNPDYLAYAVMDVVRLNIQNEALNARIAQALTLEKLAAMNPGSLACAVRDVVRLNIQNEALNARIAEALTLEKLAAMNPGPLAETVCGVGNLNIQNGDLNAKLAEALKEAKLEGLSADLSARLTESLTKLGIAIDNPEEESYRRTVEQAGPPRFEGPAKMPPKDAIADAGRTADDTSGPKRGVAEADLSKEAEEAPDAKRARTADGGAAPQAAAAGAEAGQPEGGDVVMQDVEASRHTVVAYCTHIEYDNPLLNSQYCTDLLRLASKIGGAILRDAMIEFALQNKYAPHDEIVATVRAILADLADAKEKDPHMDMDMDVTAALITGHTAKPNPEVIAPKENKPSIESPETGLSAQRPNSGPSNGGAVDITAPSTFALTERHQNTNDNTWTYEDRDTSARRLYALSRVAGSVNSWIKAVRNLGFDTSSLAPVASAMSLLRNAAYISMLAQSQDISSKLTALATFGMEVVYPYMSTEWSQTLGIAKSTAFAVYYPGLTTVEMLTAYASSICESNGMHVQAEHKWIPYTIEAVTITSVLVVGVSSLSVPIAFVALLNAPMAGNIAYDFTSMGLSTSPGTAIGDAVNNTWNDISNTDPRVLVLVGGVAVAGLILPAPVLAFAAVAVLAGNAVYEFVSATQSTSNDPLPEGYQEKSVLGEIYVD